MKETILSSAGIESLENKYTVKVVADLGGGYYLCILEEKLD